MTEDVEFLLEEIGKKDLNILELKIEVEADRLIMNKRRTAHLEILRAHSCPVQEYMSFNSCRACKLDREAYSYRPRINLSELID